MTLRVYIAAPYAARETAAYYLTQLDRIGYTVRCRWADGTHEVGPEGAATEVDPTERARWAREDLEDVAACDVLVALTAASVLAADEQLARGTSGGRHVETGYALALSKDVFLLGEPENVFHGLLPIHRVASSWDTLVVKLASHLVETERAFARIADGVTS